MTATDWESRELESASRERLLVEIGVLQRALIAASKTFGPSELLQKISELEQKISELEQKNSELEQNFFAARDFAMGAASRTGEAQAQLTTQAGQLTAARTRIEFLSKYINRIRDSTTWKLGRIVMLPVRVLKKITGKAS